ncbi:MAG: SDR family oxidoreductase [Sporocytophaga sp.]|uniref:SDR family oxidoreductase n=1 Tax=Sporocytophaga sp. TaxID=2231183 RepID=UPI001B01667C|nr:SDR family oxidoreductase [Sporocytophaga sp.]MBO9702737.1 SDR family oxidoreductase [Sporocytophaga sp.]
MLYQDRDYVLTGATGILGSHVLYELLRMRKEKILSGKIILLSRSIKSLNVSERIEKLFDDDLIPDYIKAYDKRELLSMIHIIDADLKTPGLFSETLKSLTKKAVFIHLASIVDLGTKKSTREKIYENNYLPTINLLTELEEIIDRFIFVSTAFASGEREGIIDDEFLGLDFNKRKFRNHYERIKLETEHEVSKICIEKKISYQILRPSIICGRLMDAPYFVMPKFLTFYLVGGFFYSMKNRSNGNMEMIRISANNSSVLNIVPVDYAAKAIVRAMERDDITELNIVSNCGVTIAEIGSIIFNCLDFEDYMIVMKEPEEKNQLEQLYYKIVGEQFNRYIHSGKTEFATNLLESVMNDLESPDVRKNLGSLFEYAFQKKFIDSL